MKIIISEIQIRTNWDSIKTDPYFPFPEMIEPEEFINKVKTSNVIIGGAEIIIMDKLPK